MALALNDTPAGLVTWWVLPLPGKRFHLRGNRQYLVPCVQADVCGCSVLRTSRKLVA